MIKFFKMLLAWIVSLFDDGRPKDLFFKGSMFFPTPDGIGVDSALGFANIDVADTDAHRRYSIDAIAKCGGDALVYIAEKLFNNPTLQAELTGENSEIVKYARSKGVNRWIVVLKNDNHKFPFANVEALIQQIAIAYKWASDKEMVLVTCLESDEVQVGKPILTPVQVRQMIGWCNKYAPGKRVIIGSANDAWLKQFKDSGAELWLEIQPHPFQLSMANAEAFVQKIQALKAFGPVWAGEYGRGQGDAAKYVTRRAREIGCVGIGSYVQ